jgi:hypothetical protein
MSLRGVRRERFAKYDMEIAFPDQVRVIPGLGLEAWDSHGGSRGNKRRENDLPDILGACEAEVAV